MTEKPTPGPWRVRDEDGEPYTDVMAGDRLLASAYPEYSKYDHRGSADQILRAYDEAKANARLIAAAPELYRQLEDAQMTLEEATKLLVERYPSVANHIVNPCAIRCAAALAKARGEP